ncbi:MAG: flagellar FliJ family protein [Deltaproteobacteria bacterium]|nr:flagellar FliJ family protein [Deltaproteobacteria bacterium]
MSQRLKTVSRIGELLDHQKEVIELQCHQIQSRLTQEKTRLTELDDQLQDNIGRFEEGLKNRWVVNQQDVDYLYGISSFLLARIEWKNKEIACINRELNEKQAVLLEAYKKMKAFEVFKNKMVFQEKREGDLGEQKSLDYLSLVKRSRK